MNLGNKSTVSQITVCETVVTKICNFKKYKKIHFFYLSFLIIHVAGTYFINHKIKDYFPESAWLLNLSMNEYLKGIKEP